MTLPLVAQRVLAFLALQGRPVSRTNVGGTLWPGATDVQAQASLRSALWRIRTSANLVVQPNRCDLILDTRIDVDLDHQLYVAHRHATGVASLCRVGLDIEALRGELLPDWYDEWLTVERERLKQLRLHALERLSERLVAADRIGEGVDAAFAAVSQDSLRETARRALISAYLAEGNIADARNQAEAYERLLAQRLGERPSSQFAAMSRRMEAMTHG